MLLARRAALASSVAVTASFSTARASMAPVVPLPTTASLADAPLKPLLAPSSAVTKASELWREQPVVILAVRRPGCQLCRAEASRLHSIKPQLDQAGVRLVAVLHEEREEQVLEFRSEFWPGELFLDENKEVFKAVGGGALRRGSLTSFLNPFSRIWCALRPRDSRGGLQSRLLTAHARRTHVKNSNFVEKSNLVGDGLTFGGLLVVRRDGTVQYAFQVRSSCAPPPAPSLSPWAERGPATSQEETFGDHAPPQDVLDAVLKAASA